MTFTGLQISLSPAAETMTTASMTCCCSRGFLLSSFLQSKTKKQSGDGGQRCGSTISFHGRGKQLPILSLRTRSSPTTCAVASPHSSASLSTTVASPGDESMAAAIPNEHLQHYQSPLVKMCGITTPDDASLAAQAGAWYVGMIMWPHSKRSVKSWSLAREICAAAREFGAEPVGVFVSESASEIERACDAAGLSFAQLHGDGARASVLELSKSLQTIYVMQSDAQGFLQTTISHEQERVIDWVLVDGLEGGSGSTFAWDNFKVPSLCTNKGWLLAGGLNPENVARAISTLRPNAVDVASGIAGSDGIRKDPSRIHAFMEAVRAPIGSACVAV